VARRRDGSDGGAEGRVAGPLSGRVNLADHTLPPARIETARFVLQRWRVEDAPALTPILDENVAHLTPWIPWRVAAPGTLEEITARIEGWSRDFDEGRNFIWAIWVDGGRDLAGAVGIYPRDANGRVSIDRADRAEIGYWLSMRAAGHGYATDAAREVVRITTAMPRMIMIEMRCDPANEKSIAIPRRLGFHEVRRAAETPAAAGDPPEDTVVWALPLNSDSRA